MHRFNDHDERYFNDEDPLVRPITPLQPTQPPEPEEADPSARDPDSGKPTKLPYHQDPGLQALFINHHISITEDSPDSDPPRSASGTSDHDRDSSMSGQTTAIQPSDLPSATQSTSLSPLSRPSGPHHVVGIVTDPVIHNAVRVEPVRTAAQQSREINLQAREDSAGLVARPRVDSAQQSNAGMSPPKRTSHTPQHSPLKLETVSPPQAVSEAATTIESIKTSPNLSKRMIPVAEGTANTLPAVHAISPVKGAGTTSPQSLPSFTQFTNQLNEKNHLKELAEAATQEARAPVATGSHHHSQSFGSAASQSPILPYFSHPSASHASPLAVSLTAKSPISTISDGTSYASPQQQQSYNAYYNDRRRSSAATDHVPSFPPPTPNLPSMPSASSSGESRGRAASNGDGYSTNHTTPIETQLAADGSARPAAQPLAGMSGPFKCDYPDCNHAFQTQYLLSSHKTVHSQIRPHYCPVKDCPRGEHGKGFKRKNEMIRHGLVHSSPGYICPFCPDRNHKYPRPDNLQRHVRVHHVDKDKDDPALREVLSQRAEGTGKTRRRRTQGSIGSA